MGFFPPALIVLVLTVADESMDATLPVIFITRYGFIFVMVCVFLNSFAFAKMISKVGLFLWHLESQVSSSYRGLGIC